MKAVHNDENNHALNLTEREIVRLVKNFLIDPVNGNWHEDKVVEASLHGHGADLKLVGGKGNGEHFTIECKGKSKSNSCNKENNWIHALGQIITRMDKELVIKNGKTIGKPNTAYKYGLGLYWQSAQVALYRISKSTARTLQLHIFSVYEDGTVKKWTPSKFGVKYSEDEFKK